MRRRIARGRVAAVLGAAVLGDGGDGGGSTGDPGGVGGTTGVTGGDGGSQSAVGAVGTGTPAGSPGTGAVGGTCGGDSNSAGGGGGSGFGLAGVVFESGVRSGNGEVTITPVTDSCTPVTPDGPTTGPVEVLPNFTG